ncbi:MAG: YbaB/EbfC family nucleoid-associated protein [Phycisphaerales bacterium]
MFESFKAAGALANLMRNKDAVQDAIKRVQANLENMRVVGDGGGGAVKVTLNGRMRVLDVAIDPAMFKSADAASVRMASQIIADATNTAISKAQEVVAKEISREAEQMGLPTGGLEKLLG